MLAPDLISLLILALWSIVLNHIPAIARVKQAGVAWGAGNREEPVAVAAWVSRADRAQRNHHDNLAMIATVILIAQVTGQADGVSAIAAVAVVLCRILHSLTYIAGIAGVRSLAYFGSIVGVLVIVWRIWT